MQLKDFRSAGFKLTKGAVLIFKVFDRRNQIIIAVVLYVAGVR